MILKSLVDYYEILLERNEIEKEGWIKADVGYAITIDRTGEVKNIVSLADRTDEAKNVPKKSKANTVQKVVPVHNGRSGKVPPPYFMCDNAKYLLGAWQYLGKADEDEKNKKQAYNYHKAAADYHKEILQNSNNALAQSVCNFFDSWDFETNKERLNVDWGRVLKASNLVFRSYETGGDMLNDIEIQNVWDKYCETISDQRVGRCLVTGNLAPIAKLHPVVKGMEGTQPKLVSFNASAFESYGKEQGENAPISENAANAYGKALNYMLSQKTHFRYIGDITIVFWAATKENEVGYMHFMEEFLGNTEKQEEEKLLYIINAISQGNYCEYSDLELKPETEFYILGMAPNNGRISVCLFYNNTFKDLVVNVKQHYDRLSIQGPAYEKKKYPSIHDILNATTRKQAGYKENTQSMKGIEKSLLNAVLFNRRYPVVLYISILNRINAEICQSKSALNRNRAAMIKAYIMQNFPDKKEVVNTMQLNEETEYIPYLLGRLFAVLEDVQHISINKETLREHYFNVASRTPALIFPRMMRLANNYLKVLKREKEGLRITKEKEINALMDKIHSDIPRQLSVEDQGIFMLGYYHQVQKRYEKTNKENN
ncbi:MAG: type I-C CRISPR-associated protein Cas8c/Csd1 [Lachnospiraceae bacterium]|nr:type I-C CRISPR-associated protein Cas8c/Csd1 [Lachnospiraceae bacterium]